MTKRAPPTVRFLRGLTDREQFKTLSDGELLARYAAGNDEAAFEALVGRHGAMVLQVCRSFLRNEADAEDAFQVTFLVLARQARSVRKAGSLGSWLYGVAYHTALKSRRAAATRRRHEAKAVAGGTTGPPDDLSWREAQEIFYEELAALPEKYRAPLVLCYLEGRRQDEAETLLGLPEGRLRGLVERAREHLRSRLVRRGLGPGAVFFAVLGSSAASAAPPVAGVVAAGAGVARQAEPT
jgi:RNA polymerase sigma factor (sigma-70 family)